MKLIDISNIFVSMSEMTADTSRLDRTVFYALEKAIKSYRQFAQRNLREQSLDITIDQWLLLKTIHDEPGLSQKEMSQRVFKDYASITRMIELLVKRGYLKRSFHKSDRRRFKLALTEEGETIYKQLIPVISSNRKTALEGFTDQQIETLHHLLSKMTNNCID